MRTIAGACVLALAVGVTPTRASAAERVAAPAAVGGVEWGVVATGANVFAVGPPPPVGLAAGGVELRAEARWAGGLVAGGALRMIGKPQSGFGMLRIRVEPTVGYAWRRGHFELLAFGALTIEPWVVLDGPHVARTVDRRPASALLGGAAHLEPAGRITLRRGGSLRIGVYLELAGSAIPTAHGGVARVRGRASDGSLEDLFRAGGLEVTFGLVIGGWAPARRSASGP